MRVDLIDRIRWRRHGVRYAIVAVGLVAIVGSGGGGDDCGLFGDWSDKCFDFSGGVPDFQIPWAEVEPQRQTVQVGSPATFTVTAGNVDQPSYRWCRVATSGAEECTEIAGATGESYTLAAANLGDDGAVFRVTVYAGNGSPSAQAVAAGSLAVSAMPPVVIRDGGFVESDWAVSAIATPSDNGSAYAASRSAAGGNPDAYRAVTFDLPPPQSSVHIFFTSMSARWDPSSQGPILSVDFAEDCSTVSSYLPFTMPLIEQAGRRFTAPRSVGGTRGCRGTGWYAVQRPSFAQAHFVLVDGPTCSTGETCPDFSAAGAPMRFGHISMAALQSGVPGGEMVRFSYGIDNWQVSIWRR
jgi:hypothetical protein